MCRYAGCLLLHPCGLASTNWQVTGRLLVGAVSLKVGGGCSTLLPPTLQHPGNSETVRLHLS